MYPFSPKLASCPKAYTFSKTLKLLIFLSFLPMHISVNRNEIILYTHTHTHTHMGFPGGSVVKNPPANAGDVGSIPGLGRSHGEGNGHPLQHSCLGNPMDRGAWGVTVHGVTKEFQRLVDKTTYMCTSINRYTHTYHIYININRHTHTYIYIYNFPVDHTLPVSFMLWQSSQHCYLLERGVCLLGKSDWSQGPRRVAVLPLSLFLLFLEQTQWSEAQLLGDRNSGQEVPMGMSRPGVDKPECCWRERIRHFADWMWSGTRPASLVRDLLCLALRVLRLFWIHGYYFKIGVFTLKI